MSKVAEFTFLGFEGKQGATKHIIQVKWNWPLTSQYKPNSDGSFLGNPRRAREAELLEMQMETR